MKSMGVFAGSLRGVMVAMALGGGVSHVAPAQTQPAPANGDLVCNLVKDAYGNLTLDPRCPPQPPAQSPAQPPAQGAPAGTAAAPAAKRFPYPGEVQPDEAPVPPPQTSPQAPASGTAPAAKRFPYPGEEEAPTPSTGRPGQPPLQDAGSSGESSSSSSSSSSASSPQDGSSSSSSDHGRGTGGGEEASGDPGAAPPPHRTRRKLPPVERQSPSEREQEDVQVAGFYIDDGNFKGAYDRAKDAVMLDKTDPSAHLALAESARKLGKLDEAEAEYKQCLALDPVPKERKVAEKALREMTGAG